MCLTSVSHIPADQVEYRMQSLPSFFYQKKNTGLYYFHIHLNHLDLFCRSLDGTRLCLARKPRDYRVKLARATVSIEKYSWFLKKGNIFGLQWWLRMFTFFKKFQFGSVLAEHKKFYYSTLTTHSRFLWGITRLHWAVLSIYLNRSSSVLA